VVGSEVASTGFNPVLGFLSVSTVDGTDRGEDPNQFQSRAGFSECLDVDRRSTRAEISRFQSRAGFSECLDDLELVLNPRTGSVSIPCWVF